MFLIQGLAVPLTRIENWRKNKPPQENQKIIGIGTGDRSLQGVFVQNVKKKQWQTKPRQKVSKVN